MVITTCPNNHKVDVKITENYYTCPKCNAKAFMSEKTITRLKDGTK
tara:strand:- start:621 stop:758 length:138 start_codon:yes stop_codon:yes gene_type:complete